MAGFSTGERRLVLFGKTRSGKSASANTIMGRILFQSRMSASSVTRGCQRETTDITVEEDGEEDGRSVPVRRRRRVTVVDTPGLGDTRFSEDQIHTEIARAVILSAPGPHAFLLVVPIGAYTENENQAASQFTRMFGEEAVRHHTVVLFTKGDELELDNTTIEQYLREAPESLRALINRCEGRYHVFNNRDRNNSTQVRDLLMKVDNMVMQNNNRFYTNAMYEEAVAALREEQRLRDQRRVQAPERRTEPRRHRVRARRQPPLLTSGFISPTVLQRVRAVVAAVATGLAVGAALGAAVPLAAAAGAYVGGSVVGFVAPAAAAAAAEAAGVIVAAASGTTALAVGAGVGAFVGGVTGAMVGADAERPGEAAMETLREVGGMGVCAVGAAAVVGAGAGARAALRVTPVETVLNRATAGGSGVLGLLRLAVSVNRSRRFRYTRDGNGAAYDENDLFQFNIGNQP
ncbi:uncharacterized protein V6R79_004604 [Siganus canaliculatus]